MKPHQVLRSLISVDESNEDYSEMPPLEEGSDDEAMDMEPTTEGTEATHTSTDYDILPFILDYVVPHAVSFISTTETYDRISLLRELLHKSQGNQSLL